MTRAWGLRYELFAISHATLTTSVMVSSKDERALLKSCVHALPALDDYFVIELADIVPVEMQAVTVQSLL